MEKSVSSIELLNGKNSIDIIQFTFSDSNKSTADVLAEFEEHGKLSGYHADGVSYKTSYHTPVQNA